jgi:hypothetical protein
MTRLFIIRHAERRKIVTQADVPRTPLTEKGKADSAIFGMTMRYKLDSEPISIITGEYLRCFQTGSCFAKGYGLGNVVMLPRDPSLNSLGVYREELDGEVRKRYNHIFKHEIYGETMKQWKKGFFKDILVDPSLLFDAIMQLVELSRTKTMFIFAHDTNVSAIGICNGIKELYLSKPPFLCGAYMEDHKSGEWQPFAPQLGTTESNLDVHLQYRRRNKYQHCSTHHPIPKLKLGSHRGHLHSACTA